MDINNIYTNPKVQNIIKDNDEAGKFLSVLTSLFKVKGKNIIYNNNNNNKEINIDQKFHTPIEFDATCSIGWSKLLLRIEIYAENIYIFFLN
jgi:hypothetical protein